MMVHSQRLCGEIKCVDKDTPAVITMPVQFTVVSAIRASRWCIYVQIWFIFDIFMYIFNWKGYNYRYDTFLGVV